MDAAPAGKDSIHLGKGARRQAAESTPLGPLVIHEVIREQGQTELDRSFGGLALSGLSAGLSIGFSFLVQAALQAGLPDAPWPPRGASVRYPFRLPIGVPGQQQLFTETTLTAVLPVLTERTLARLGQMLRVWAIVLVANLIGAALLGALLAQPGVMPTGMAAAMDEIAGHVFQTSFGHGVLAAAFSGWLIGLMVWLLPPSGDAKPLIIILLTYAIAICHFTHVVAGAVEAAYAVAAGHETPGAYLKQFFLPTLIGNVLGGTLLAALLNHAPVAGELDSAGEG